jgi:O-antigen/teichoic acid export membrane protein
VPGYGESRAFAMMKLQMQPAESGPLGKLFALLAGVVLLIVGFMFSMVILAVVAVVGIAVWAYLWWKTRDLRKAMRERPPGGHVVDGEAVVVDDPPPGRIAGDADTRGR